MNLTHAHFKMDDYHIRSPAFVTPYLDDYSLSTRDFFKNRSVFLEIEEGMEDDLVSTSSFANLLLEKSNMVKLHLSELVLADKEAKSYNEKYPWEIPIPFLGPKPIKSNFVIGSFEDYEERVRLERLELLRVKSANDQYNAKRDLINKAKERERIMAGSRGNYPLPFFNSFSKPKFVYICEPTQHCGICPRCVGKSNVKLVHRSKRYSPYGTCRDCDTDLSDFLNIRCIECRHLQF